LSLCYFSKHQMIIMSNFIYRTFLPIRLILVLNAIGGICVGLFSVYSYINDIQIGVLIFAFPLLSMAMIINAFSTSRVRLISYKNSTSSIEILKQSLFKFEWNSIDTSLLKVELLSPNKNKLFSIPVYVLNIYKNDVLIEEINSSFLSLNNIKIANAFSVLKELSQRE